MKIHFLLAGLLLQAATLVQAEESRPTAVDYTYAELRFVDVDVAGGSGLRLNGSYKLANNWLLVGGVTTIEFDSNVDSFAVELGGGYVWPYTQEFDLYGTVRLVRAEFDSPLGGANENGVALTAGTRGLITSQFEVRGSVNHINLDDSDTYVELGGDYHFTEVFSAGLTLELAGDADVISVGARWFF
jgi:hypothetical protein